MQRENKTGKAGEKKFRGTTRASASFLVSTQIRVEQSRFVHDNT